MTTAEAKATIAALRQRMRADFDQMKRLRDALAVLRTQYQTALNNVAAFTKQRRPVLATQANQNAIKLRSQYATQFRMFSALRQEYAQMRAQLAAYEKALLEAEARRVSVVGVLPPPRQLPPIALPDVPDIPASIEAVPGLVPAATYQPTTPPAFAPPPVTAFAPQQQAPAFAPPPPTGFQPSPQPAFQPQPAPVQPMGPPPDTAPPAKLPDPMVANGPDVPADAASARAPMSPAPGAMPDAPPPVLAGGSLGRALADAATALPAAEATTPTAAWSTSRKLVAGVAVVTALGIIYRATRAR